MLSPRKGHRIPDQMNEYEGLGVTCTEHIPTDREFSSTPVSTPAGWLDFHDRHRNDLPYFIESKISTDWESLEILKISNNKIIQTTKFYKW